MGNNRNVLIWLLMLVAFFLMWASFQRENVQSGREITYTEFMKNADEGVYSQVRIRGEKLMGVRADGADRSIAPYDPDMVKILRDRGVNVRAEATDPGVMSILLGWVPMLIFIAFLFWMMRQQMGGKGGAMSFGRSRATLLTENQIKVTFDDVAGVDEAKQELEEIVQYLKDPGRFSRLGGKIPKGALLVGSPGTGKTLLAKAVAGEAGVPFFSISGSDFVEMFVGVGAARVRDLFEQGKKNAPCIIFIDEIDAVGRHRGAGFGGGNDEREQTLNQLLVEMDGFDSNEGVILLAATNRPDVLDPALMRPGRFDRQIVVPLPDIRGRTQVLKTHMQKVPLGADVDAEVIARGTPGFSGADLANLVNEAALMAARRNKRLVDMEDFEAAKDKVMMGAERRSTVMTDEQKKTTAYHEAGHAIVAMYLDGPTDPVHKVTIIPRGRALGVTMQLPEEDKFTYDRKYLENQISILMGGRLAEELVMNQMTTGAGNDIERATNLARKMVCSWGMSDKMGPQTFGEGEGEVFLGRDYASQKSAFVSEETSAAVDREIRKFIDSNYDRAKKLLQKHMDKLHQLSQALLEYETLDKHQIDDLFSGKGIVVKSSYQRKKSAGGKDVGKTTTKPKSKSKPKGDPIPEA